MKCASGHWIFLRSIRRQHAECYRTGLLRSATSSTYLSGLLGPLSTSGQGSNRHSVDLLKKKKGYVDCRCLIPSFDLYEQKLHSQMSLIFRRTKAEIRLTRLNRETFVVWGVVMRRERCNDDDVIGHDINPCASCPFRTPSDRTLRDISLRLPIPCDLPDSRCRLAAEYASEIRHRRNKHIILAQLLGCSKRSQPESSEDWT